MHELGLVIDAVEMTERYAVENDVEQIQTLVLRIGEGFSAVPEMMQSVYRQAIKGTLLEDSRLEIEIVEAQAICAVCRGSFNPLREKGVCPFCGASRYEVISGKEFEIKEIIAKQKAQSYEER